MAAQRIARPWAAACAKAACAGEQPHPAGPRLVSWVQIKIFEFKWWARACSAVHLLAESNLCPWPPCKQVWVPSQFGVESFARGGVDPSKIYVLPQVNFQGHVETKLFYLRTAKHLSFH